MNEALEIVRKKYDKNLIWYWYEYTDKYVFAVAPDKKFVNGDLALLQVTVDKKNGEIGDFNYFEELFSNPDELRKSVSNKIFIDITEEQLKR